MVLADTHLPRKGRTLPQRVLSELERADIIIHLGDFTEISVARMLQSHARLAGVHGNNDCPEICAQFPATRQLTLGGQTLALLHGHLGGGTALQAARKVTGSTAVLFGHSHRPYCSWVDGILFFNPGSPTDRRWSPSRSFGLMEIGEVIEARIVHLP